MRLIQDKNIIADITALDIIYTAKIRLFIHDTLLINYFEAHCRTRDHGALGV